MGDRHTRSALGSGLAPRCIPLLLLGFQFIYANDKNATTLPLEAEEVARMEPSKLKELVVTSQDQIEITSKLDGVLVVSMRLSKQGDQRVRAVDLEGRVRNAQQRSLVAKVVFAAMQSDSFWNTSDDEFVVNPDKLVVTEPSLDIGTKSLGMAMEQYFAGNHEQADLLLTHALVESPGREVIHYWKVANCLALKQSPRAERRLAVLTQRNPLGSDTYAGQLQRLQGQNRRAIIEMEQKMMLNNRLGNGAKPN